MKRLMAVMMFAALVGCGGTMDEAGADATPAGSSIPMEYSKQSGGTSGSTSSSTSALKASTGPMTATTTAWQTTFPATTTFEIEFAIDFGKLRGNHNATLFVQMPDGSYYQRFDVSFATTSAALAGQQQAQKLANGGWRVWVSLPVEGTAIDTYGLVGNWSAQAYLDGSSTPTGTEAFAIQ